ncbi:hypothetical protein ACGFZL_22040 [Streptomyces sp. NPDC048182]|uniref:SCO2102 family sporulation regulator n=1 Tax=Streptomyces sp. NPDC048182 TaxID=3365507 RepID=UPI0037115443
MGWTVLYIAFGIVALWLLGEVLLQYKARLRWRLLAFGGFVGVVVGVLLPSVVVIGLGAITFAIGQTYVTLSFRRGFESGWAVNAPEGLVGSRRRRPERAHRDPALEVSGLEAAEPADDRHEGPDQQPPPAPYAYDAYGQDDPDHDDVFAPGRPAETTAVYEPQPMPDDTGSYGVYPGADADTGAGRPYAYDYSAYAQQDGHHQGYGYDAAQQQYAAYSDPYIGTYGGTAPYDTGGGWDTSGGQQYGQQGYAPDPYAGAQSGGETPAGGVWVPQQRNPEDPYGAELPPEQGGYPYQGDGQPQQPQGYDEQYRF